MNNQVFSDYGLINLTTPKGRQEFYGALTAFMKQPREVIDKLITAGVTAFTATSQFPEDVRTIIEKLHLGIDMIDSGWQGFFDMKDFTGTRESGFGIQTVSSGLTFGKRPEGGRARIYRVTGARQWVGFDMYGGGLEFDQAWFDDQQWWMIEDTAVEFRSKWYRDLATVMYTLIGALGAGQNVAYDTTGADALEKDIITINTAAAQVLTALDTAGYAVTPSTPLVILSPIQLRARLNRALAAVNLPPAATGAELKIEYNVAPVYSMKVLNAGAACTDKWYLGVKGIKNKFANRMDLTVWANFKSASYATETVGWGRYGAYLNEEQLLRLATT